MSFQLSVSPTYGLGWTDGVVTIDTPSGFTAVADRIGDNLVGVVRSGKFAGWALSMSKRHLGPFDGVVNATIQNGDASVIFSGFAEISKDLME